MAAYNHDRAKRAQAIVNVVQAISDRAGDVPSTDVQNAAMRYMENGPGGLGHKITACMGGAQTYHAERESGKGKPYLLAVYRSKSGDVIDAECSCDASTTCKHLLAILAREDLDGHPLAT